MNTFMTAAALAGATMISMTAFGFGEKEGPPIETDCELLWAQFPLPASFLSLPDQEFGGDPTFGEPDFSSYIVSDVYFTDPVTLCYVKTTFTDGDSNWPRGEIGTAILNIFPIDSDAGSVDPRDGMEVEVYYDDESLPRTICVGNVEPLGIELDAGGYFIGLTPVLNFETFGQEYHHPALVQLPVITLPSFWRNPGGAQGEGTDWLPTFDLNFLHYDSSIIVLGQKQPKLESIDVAIQDAATGKHVLLRGFRDGLVQHKFYTPEDGHGQWTEVPDPNATITLTQEDLLESVEVFAYDEGLLYIRAFESGRIQQNFYTFPDGFTGWFDLPHEEEDDECDPEEAGCINLTDGPRVESTDVVALDGLFGPRIFVRAWTDGLIEQCVYTPGDGFMGWSEVPPMGNLLNIADNTDDRIESVQVTNYGGLTERRIFVVGLEQTRRVYQNIYTPQDGYTGWKRVRNFNNAGNPFAGGDCEENDDCEEPPPLVSVDVQELADGSVIYLRGRENGAVRQNIYTQKDGYSGWDRVTRRQNPDDEILESVSIEAFGEGFFGPRIFVRCFRNGLCEQSSYDPKTGQTDWTEIPGGEEGD